MLQEMLDDLRGKRPPEPQLRDEAAKRLVERCGYAAAALTLIPIPLSELVAVTPVHVAMVTGVAHVYGQEVTRDGASKLIVKIGATVGLSWVGARIATTAAKFLLPGIGGLLLGAPFMYGSTVALGTVARAWFEQGGLSDTDVSDIYKRALDRARRTFDLERAKDGGARQAAEEAAAEAANAAGAAHAPSATEAGPNGSDAPAASAAPTLESRLADARGLRDKGLIDDAEYAAVKQRILEHL